MVQIILIASLILLNSSSKVSSHIACGQRNTSFWPWHVSIRHFNQDPDVPACGGTILNDLFIITAGHCVYDLSGNEIAPRELIVTVDRPSESRTVHVKLIVFPYTFNVNKFENDVVLLKLYQSITFSDKVNPICFSEEADIMPADSVTIPINTKQSRAVHTETWKITNYSLCHGTNYYIFNTSYNHSICMGYVRATDKFQLHRGSALMIQQNHSWHMVGVLLYTIGPNENTATYGGGLVLAAYAKAIIKTVNRHLIPTISNTKCEYYNEIAKENFKTYFSPYISLQRKNDDYVIPGCIGTLISETFVLTAAICTQMLEKVVLWSDILNTTHYQEFRVHYHPMDVYRQGIALVELMTAATHMENLIHCLWTNDEDHPMMFHTKLKHGTGILELDANVQYRPKEPISYRLEDCFRFTVSLICKPGDLLTTKKVDEKVNRIVGLITEQVEDCSPKKALNVVSYLDWIEETVWDNTNTTASSNKQ